MINIVQATLPAHGEDIREIFAEYLRWVCPRIYQEYKVFFDAEAILSRDMDALDKFLPPQGFLLLAYDDHSLAGCGCIRTIGIKIAEIKRMYVRPGFRQRGIGSALVNEFIQRFRDLNYSEMRLDSAGFMTDAHRIYKSMGFTEITHYKESEIPEEHSRHWKFMKLSLD
jgi:GNAT superfamily N-acetyltransferase